LRIGPGLYLDDLALYRVNGYMYGKGYG